MARIKEHWAAILLAICVGFTIVFPHLLVVRDSGSQYGGFSVFETDGEYFYHARVQEIYDGHYSMSNPLLAGKDVPYIYPPLPEFIIGMIGKTLNLSLNSILNLVRFLAPAVIFLLVYALVLRMSGENKATALTAAVLVLLVPNLLSYPKDLLDMIRGTFTSGAFADYARPINPQFNALIFFGFLYSFWQMIYSDKKRFFVACIFLFGAAFYAYLYTWTFLTVFLGLYASVLLWQKNYALLKKTLLIFVFGIVIAIPYFVNLYEATQHFYYPSLAMRNGLHESHEFVFSSIFVLAAILIFGLRRHPAFWFFASLVAAGIIAVNQQVVTGQALQYGHYHWYFNRPVVIIIGVVLLFQLLNKITAKKSLHYAAFGFLLAIAWFYVSHLQIAGYRSNAPSVIYLQRYGPVLRWLKDNASKDQVVYIPQSYPFTVSGKPDAGTPSMLLNQQIPMYTSLNVYYDNRAGQSLLPHPDYDDYNLMLTLKLLGVEPDQAVKYLQDDNKMLTVRFGTYYETRGQGFDSIPKSWFDEFAKKYKAFYALTWKDILAKYQLDYIVWDRGDLPKLPLPEISKESAFREAYNAGGVLIYQR